MKRVLTVMEAIGEYLKTLLFDINFNRYISLQIIPLCYISVLILTAGGLLWLIVHGFMDNIWRGFFYLCLSPVLFLLWVFQRRPVRPVQSTRQDTPPPTNNRR